MCHQLLRILVCLAIATLATTTLSAQGPPQRQERGSRPDFDPRRWLESLDANKNGRLDPNELTGRAREFAAPRLKEIGIDVNKSVSIKRIVSAVAKSRAARNAPPPSVPGFGVEPEFTSVPGFDVEFGSALAAIGSLDDRYQPRVLERLQQTLDRYDKNKDGVLDRREISEARWIYGDPSKNDLNGDGMLTKSELAERYLARGKFEKSEEKKREKESKELNQLFENPQEWKKRWEQADGDQKRRMGEVWKRRYDQAQSDEEKEKIRADFGVGGARQRTERATEEQTKSDEQNSGGADHPPGRHRSETNHEARRRRSIYRRVSTRDKLEELGLEDDFISNDTNGDGQLQMSEFESKWTRAKLEKFREIDSNGDGVISPAEWLNE